MKFINHNNFIEIEIIKDGVVLDTIKSIQYLDEDTDTVILRCAEFVSYFEKGFTCDFRCNYEVGSTNDMSKFNELEEQKDTIRDLVLVYIKRTWDLDSATQFEYVFYK